MSADQQQFVDQMQSGSWYTLVQYGFIMTASGATSAIICFALRLLQVLRQRKNFESSPSLLVYLLSMLLCSVALCVQYSLLLLYTFLPSSFSSFSPTKFIFWTGLFPGSLIPATPISVLFLSLDRLLIVLLPSLYMHKLTKSGLAVASTLAIFGLFAMSFGVNLGQMPDHEMPECISFGCLTSDASRLIYAVNRLVVALPNFLVGGAFLLVLFAFRRRVEQTAGGQQAISVNRSRKTGDHLALWVVIFEFTLDLLPNLVNFVLTFFDINISVYLGAFRSISYSLCALCSILAHTALLWRVFSSKIAPVSKTARDAKTPVQPFFTEENGRRKVSSSMGMDKAARFVLPAGPNRISSGGKDLARMDGPRRS